MDLCAIFCAGVHKPCSFEPPDSGYVAWNGIGWLRLYRQIWPSSPSTLRHRQKRFIPSLRPPTRTENSKKSLTLALLRPGGTTFLIAFVELSGRVGRRKCGVLLKVMDIYLTSGTPNAECSEEAHCKILTANAKFPLVRNESGYSLKARSRKRCGTFFSNMLLAASTRQKAVGEMGQARQNSAFPRSHIEDTQAEKSANIPGMQECDQHLMPVVLKPSSTPSTSCRSACLMHVFAPRGSSKAK